MFFSVSKFFNALILILFLSASNAEDYIEGKHYEVLKTPSITRYNNKIEVAEVFWFGCNHCYSLESYLSQWKKDLPSDVDFWKSHATWNETLKTHARVFYTARALGIEERLVPAAFNTIQVERRYLTGNSELEYFFKGFGVSKEKYKAVSASFGVNNAIKQADNRMRQWLITGVPTLIVNGKYKVSATREVGTNEILEVVDFLIEKERKYLKK